ncbi:MAG: hypothetical protein R3B38_00120 [Patescibacteria group bacterium]
MYIKWLHLLWIQRHLKKLEQECIKIDELYRSYTREMDEDFKYQWSMCNAILNATRYVRVQPASRSGIGFMLCRQYKPKETLLEDVGGFILAFLLVVLTWVITADNPLFLLYVIPSTLAFSIFVAVTLNKHHSFYRRFFNKPSGSNTLQKFQSYSELPPKLDVAVEYLTRYSFLLEIRVREYCIEPKNDQLYMLCILVGRGYPIVIGHWYGEVRGKEEKAKAFRHAPSSN